MFDLAAILRSAHATARHRMSASRAWRSYRQAFADALRREWYQAKQARLQAEIADELPIALPADVVARCGSLRLEASYEAHTFAGNERYREMHRQADAIEAAAMQVAA